MPELYAILGYPNCKKSSSIRALTGAGRRGLRLIAMANGTFDCFVQITSLQEAHMLPAGFIAEMYSLHAERILAPFWIDSLTDSAGTYPEAGRYLQEFLASGWTIREIVVLGAATIPYQLPNGCPNANFVINSANLAANEIASRIRQWWHWL